MNHEITEKLGGEDIVKIVESQRIRWYGHINERDENSLLKKITQWKPQGSRPRGRPKIGWEDQVIRDYKCMKITNWRQKMKDRILGENS